MEDAKKDNSDIKAIPNGITYYCNSHSSNSTFMHYIDIRRKQLWNMDTTKLIRTSALALCPSKKQNGVANSHLD